MKEIPEQKIQQDAYNWFNNNYCLVKHEPRLLIHSVPNGIPVYLPPKEMSRALDVMKKTGMVNGISDMIIHGLKGRCIMAECKTESGHQSEAQQLIQRRIQDLNGKYFVFRNLEQFQTIIAAHLPWLLGKE